MADIPLISTKELASLFRVESQTIRRGYCLNGHYLGLKPVKLDNGRLLWPKHEARQLLILDTHSTTRDMQMHRGQTPMEIRK